MKNQTIRSLFLCLSLSPLALAQTSTTGTSTTGTSTAKKSTATTQKKTTTRATTPAKTTTQRVQDTVPAVVIPAGTTVEVRVNETLTSEKAQSGDRFTGTTTEDIVVNGRTAFPKGSDVTGRVLAAKGSGRFSDPGTLELRLNTIRSGSSAAALSTESFMVEGKSHTKSNTTKIGGGAAIGAVIGAIAGGGKGAAIGAGVGGAAGAGAAAATGKQEAKVESEAVLRFVTAADATVGAASQIMQQAEREPVLQSRNDTMTSTTQSTNTATSPTTSPSTTTGTGANTTTSTQTTTNTTVAASTTTTFSAYERRQIRSCLADNATSLPLEARQRGSLTASEQQQVVRGGTLPVDWTRKVRALPYACERQLPALANDNERVIYSGRVMLIDSSNRILDVFDLEP